MNTKDYTYLLNKPYSLTDRQTTELESILREFPYLQSAHAIYLKGLYNRDSFRYNTELKKTAAYTTDRSVLFDFIISEEFRSIDKAVLEEKEKQVAKIIVSDSVVIAPAVNKLEASIKLLIKEAASNPEEKTVPETGTPPLKDTIDPDRPGAAVKLPVKEAAPEAEAAPGETVSSEPETSSPDPAIIKIPEAGRPLEFNPAEKHSFAEWLQLSKPAPIQREDPPVTLPENENIGKKYDLIDKFIEANPKIAPVKKDVQTPVNTGKNISDTPGLMTETLARVYLEQKKYTKAIQAYEILILKYPEKNAFFADRILEIKNLQQNIN